MIQGTLDGGFHMSQLVARHMVERGGGGKIVFISSCHAHTPYAGSVAYNAGKGGLNQMAFTIAAELYPHRINVNVIEPGWIDTPGEHEAFGDELMSKAGTALPWGRLGTPEDIGKAAVFLASDDADYITGAALARRRRHLAPTRSRVKAPFHVSRHSRHKPKQNDIRERRRPGDHHPGLLGRRAVARAGPS